MAGSGNHLKLDACRRLAARASSLDDPGFGPLSTALKPYNVLLLSYDSGSITHE